MGTQLTLSLKYHTVKYTAWGANERNLRSACYTCFEVKEMWWDKSHNWNATLSGYEIFRKSMMKR